MVDVQKIIQQVKKVFGDEKLPCRITITDSDGLEIFSTESSTPMEDLGSTDILGILAFEELNRTASSRDTEIETLIFRTKNAEYFIAPVTGDLFLSAVAGIGKIAPMQVFLDGLRSQITYALKDLTD
ncbi:MAG: hypothetical protein HeimC3_35180 [Candidatus Heimdallarchaeota archaeon LC_3]|nr:MAG: hypothetical protein HeimC3_35180 [Candidatus Heimdallarchaeota archaeon LC_3]